MIYNKIDIPIASNIIWLALNQFNFSNYTDMHNSLILSNYVENKYFFNLSYCNLMQNGV